MGAMADAEMWEVLSEAATMLDAADCDWHTLQQIEGMLSSVSTELERAATAEIPPSPNGSSARRADSNLRILQSALAWVRRHEYVALESELQQQHDTRGLPFGNIGSRDAS